MRLILILTCFFASHVFAAECRIIEYEALADDTGGRLVPLPREPNVTVQEVTYTTSATSAVFSSRTSFVRIRCDAGAFYRFSTVSQDISATALDAFIPVDTTVDLGIPRGANYKVEFYDGTS